jgi:hypothetical protein
MNLKNLSIFKSLAPIGAVTFVAQRLIYRSGAAVNSLMNADMFIGSAKKKEVI